MLNKQRFQGDAEAWPSKLKGLSTTDSADDKEEEEGEGDKVEDEDEDTEQTAKGKFVEAEETELVARRGWIQTTKEVSNSVAVKR